MLSKISCIRSCSNSCISTRVAVQIQAQGSIRSALLRVPELQDGTLLTRPAKRTRMQLAHQRSRNRRPSSTGFGWSFLQEGRPNAPVAVGLGTDVVYQCLEHVP